MKLPYAGNPFAAGDEQVLSKLVMELIPSSETMSVEQKADFDKTRGEAEANYREARYGVLPPNTYRILDQGSLVGWFYELEVDGEEVMLREPGIRNSEYQVHSDLPRAERLARSEIAKRFGQEAAAKALFRVVIGGSL
ncbi:hypothetical protein [Pseudomonas amygdali]|uniref:Uncharacterized protein n=2 Tax=Pseudomonas amygdali pv. lachrymans TaxID=53707 RepID=A0ABR5KRQ5_PSEAV|nr:hypothetical protein [Pseudomonas amygdali]AXH59927.1 hypothetical protein PLA107_032395 [Pseudomonas amygdali pv. lachrymans str. M301315]KPC17334.1 Uncharacterized protein AC499_0536 [Pseudomonas amygdali pv. lachrymans]RMT05770.1 hypothetical protein ALP54_03796 [Pseudomonas amygdali pv. lachrymans]